MILPQVHLRNGGTTEESLQRTSIDWGRLTGSSCWQVQLDYLLSRPRSTHHHLVCERLALEAKPFDADWRRRSRCSRTPVARLGRPDRSRSETWERSLVALSCNSVMLCWTLALKPEFI